MKLHPRALFALVLIFSASKALAQKLVTINYAEVVYCQIPIETIGRVNNVIGIIRNQRGDQVVAGSSVAVGTQLTLECQKPGAQLVRGSDKVICTRPGIFVPPLGQCQVVVPSTTAPAARPHVVKEIASRARMTRRPKKQNLEPRKLAAGGEPLEDDYYDDEPVVTTKAPVTTTPTDIIIQKKDGITEQPWFIPLVIITAILALGVVSTFVLLLVCGIKTA